MGIVLTSRAGDSPTPPPACSSSLAPFLASFERWFACTQHFCAWPA